MLAFFELLGSNSLTRLVFFPLLAAMPLLLGRSNRGLRWYLLLISLIELCFGWLLVRNRLDSQGGLRALRDVGSDGAVKEWIPSFGISFDFGLDGISSPWVALVLLLLPIVVLGSWNRADLRWPFFGASILLVAGALLGAILSIDLFLFFVFWECLLLLTFFLLGAWGGKQRLQNAMRFVILAATVDLFMLLAILRLGLLHFQAQGHWSFSYVDLLRLSLSPEQEIWIFVAFSAAFAARLALFPLHSWLPDSYANATHTGFVLIGSIAVSLGAYAFLRFAFPLLPHASLRARPVLTLLSIVGVLYGAMSAWIQSDLRRIVAFGSISQLCLVMLGISTLDLLAWQGATIHLFHHGLATATLFLLAGMLHERCMTWKLEELSGVARRMPLFATFFALGCFAWAGLPFFSGFVGEVAIVSGVFRSLASHAPWIPIAAALGLLLTTFYILRVLVTLILGPLAQDPSPDFADLLPREILTVAPLLLLMLVLGLAPQLFLEKGLTTLSQSHQRLHQSLDSRAETSP